ncbi:hypothetical protein K7X08_033612 [Anisodus acutangulus]|uniref:Uncharacterized protein n=1 Tax=Anisodus acutangulus TaxID=402998 RepID=A0A9Q1M5J4_9SOLA|nr:hypothetical protein K7X08_033612 [Anisodus acutangulus]
MGLLLGSDYTEGVREGCFCGSFTRCYILLTSGIGIVNAIEVVNAFPEEDGLHKFREWVESPDPSILGGLDAEAGSSSRKKGCKVGDPDMGCSTRNLKGNTASDENVHKSEDRAEKLKQNFFMNKHRNISKNWKPDVSVLRKEIWLEQPGGR